MENLLEKVVSLCKRRGFIFPGSDIYGGVANSWGYGPLGTELKNNIAQLWWKRFVHQRDDMVGIDAAIIMNPKVWEASEHVASFTDPLIECKVCHTRIRADQEEEKNKHESLHKNIKIEWTEPKQFNLMFPIRLGATEDSGSTSYLRGEIAQAMFVNFKNILDSTRIKLPFGIASQGKAFRNEITPGNFIFRTREFNLMEFEYFIRESDWENQFEYWRKEMWNWIEDLGLDKNLVHEREHSAEDRAHYSKKTIDLEFDFPFGRKELYGLAYRTNFDLKNHMEKSGQDMTYTDPETGEKYIPHVIEPTFGLDRSILVVLLSAYHEDDKRVVLKLNPKLAPFKAAVFPLLANKPQLVEKARQILKDLKSKNLNIAWDDRGNIGKRYYSQDEIGTPHCITVDFQTLEDDTVTIRDRDTAKQERLPILQLLSRLVF